jgi:DNA repair exonuclease SbcCD ATPase subunit
MQNGAGFVVPPRLITSGMYYVYLPTPEALVQHLVGTAQHVEELEQNEINMQKKLDDEREAHAREIKKLAACMTKNDLTEAMANLRVSHGNALQSLYNAVQTMEKNVSVVLEDPRLKEMDKKMSRLGREIKKAENSNRVIAELQRENEMLHDDVENANTMIKSFKATESELKKVKSKLAEVNRQNENETRRYEHVIASFEEQAARLHTTIMAQTVEIVHLKEVIAQLAEAQDKDI